MEGQRRVLVVDRRWCEHCGESLSFKTCKKHKKLYYNKETQKWVKKGEVTQAGKGLKNTKSHDTESPPSLSGDEMELDNQQISPPFFRK